MTAAVWPPVDPDLLLEKEEESLKAELKWLLELLQENLISLKSGLQECVALLASEEPGTTLAVSSHRSESVKGVVTRMGTRLVKGEVSLRLASLAPNNPSTGATTFSITSPFPLPQLQTLLTLLNHALDIIDISSWTGDPQNPSFISSQLKLLADTIDEATAVLQGSDNDEDNSSGGRWYDTANGDDARPRSSSSTPQSSTAELMAQHIQPASLLHTLSPHFSISSTTLTLTIRTLALQSQHHQLQVPSRTPSPSTIHPSASTSSSAPSSRPATPTPAHSFPQHNHPPSLSTPGTPPSTSSAGPQNQGPSSGGSLTSLLRTRLGIPALPSLGGGIFAPRLPPHDEEGRGFHYGGGMVSVREKVSVESSQDPGLLAIGAKLGVLRREVGGWRARVRVVVSGGLEGEDEGDEDFGGGQK